MSELLLFNLDTVKLLKKRIDRIEGRLENRVEEFSAYVNEHNTRIADLDKQVEKLGDRIDSLVMAIGETHGQFKKRIDDLWLKQRDAS